MKNLTNSTNHIQELKKKKLKLKFLRSLYIVYFSFHLTVEALLPQNLPLFTLRMFCIRFQLTNNVRFVIYPILKGIYEALSAMPRRIGTS